MNYITKILAVLFVFIVSLSGQVSIPTTPEQPDAHLYSTFDLMLFKNYDRDTYRRTFGKGAPPYDPSRRIKTWFDSTKSCDDPDEVVIYKVVGSDKSGQPAVRQMVLTACEAATINVIGREAFPKYEIQPTSAIIKGFKFDEQIVPDVPVDPVTLATRSQAEQILSELGTGSITEFSLPPPYSYLWPAAENRRQWKIGAYFVGQLIAMKQNHGIGRPGKWKVTGDTVEWIPDPLPPDGMVDSRPMIPTPVRDLLPNERLVPNPFGTRVERLDKKPVESSSGFTDADRQLLKRIVELLEKKF